MPGKEEKKQALILLSGGLDSTVSLFWALKKANFSVRTMTFDYYRRSKREILAAKKISKLVGCQSINLSLDFLKEVDDLRNLIKNDSLKSAPSAYVPCRNLIFYAIACSFSEIYDCDYIVGGHIKEDSKIFRDSSHKFFRALDKITAMALFTGSRTSRIIQPLSTLSKVDVIKLGQKLGVPFELTWSCYKQKPVPCGKCVACKLRREAFTKAGITDPLETFMARA